MFFIDRAKLEGNIFQINNRDLKKSEMVERSEHIALSNGNMARTKIHTADAKDTLVIARTGVRNVQYMIGQLDGTEHTHDYNVRL